MAMNQPASNQRMSKVQRVRAAVKNEAVDRTPVSFWYHFRLEARPVEEFANAELDFYRKYDIDWLKIMHDYPFGSPDLLGSVKSASDWRKLRPVGGREGGFAKQAEALKRIGEGLRGEAWYIDTIFDPWSTAQKLCGRHGLEHMKQDREAFRDGLRVIAESFADYVPAALEAGAAGFYLAVDGASADVMRQEDYLDLVRPADLTILEAAKSAPFNVLHIHGTRIYFEALKDYPVAGISWSYGVTAPSIAEARQQYAGCLISGLDETSVLQKNREDVQAEIKQAIKDAGGRGFIAASGCAVPTETPEDLLRAARKAVGE